MFREKNRAGLLTAAEAAGAAAVAFLCANIVIAYFADWVGFTIVPSLVLVLSIGWSVALGAWLAPTVEPARFELVAFLGVTVLVFAGLLWMSWPGLLPPGSGADLTHHLQLIDYLDRHWRLVHEPAVEAYLGEMVHYTPGAHLLASLFGRWVHRDGFHAVYSIVALSVAVKAGFILLVALRLLRGYGSRLPFALVAVALLFLPRAFVIGSFTRYSYIAQVVSEMFAVAMWWALIVWDDRPSSTSAALFALAGVGVFLTWPVWIGPPLVVLFAVVLTPGELPSSARLRTLAVATLPIAVAAAAHAIGRLAWTRIAGTDADMQLPSATDFNRLFLAIAAVGLVALAASRRARTTAMLVAACVLQAAALFLVARAGGAKVPYMAVKMAYLTIYPLAAGGALVLALAWQTASRLPVLRRASNLLAWAFAAVLTAAVVLQTALAPRQPPAVTEGLYLAGQWARAHLDPGCVDYIVRSDNTAYWLHLAVLGNRRMSARTADDRTFVTNDAIVRWINPGGLPYAVADLGTIPKDVLADNDELARFDSAVVIKRRGPSACADGTH